MSGAQKPKLPINLVPEQIEPGSIIDDRYCVVSRFEPEGRHWIIGATDLARVFGRSPHHRVGLHKVSTEHSQEHRLRVALRCDNEVQPRFRELRHLFDGLLIVADYVSGAGLPSVLRSEDAFAVAEAASALLGRLHSAGVRGIHFSRDQFVLEDGRAYLTSFRHLNAPGSLQSDLDGLHDFLAALSTDIHKKLAPRPKSAIEYAQRFATDGKQFVWSDVLPPIAPYVTPHAVVENVFDLFIEARRGNTREVRITAPRGYGKTRLLNELAAEFTQQGDATVILAEASTIGLSGKSVLERIFEELTHQCGALPVHTAQRVRAKVCEAIEGFEGVIATAVPRFGMWLGIDLSAVAPKIDIGESFARQATVLAAALRAVSSQQRPLVVLVDNAEALDVASVALIEELRRRFDGHVLLVVAYLNGVRLESQPHAAHRLPPFGEAQVREFVERSLPGEIEDPIVLAAHLYTTTDGRPLNCWAVLQDWISDGTIARSKGAWVLTRSLSPDLVQAEKLFDARLSNVEEDAFRTVLCFALSDVALTRAQLAEVLDWSDTRVSNAVRNAIKNAIIQSIEGQIGFNHGTVPELVLQKAVPEVKTAMHHRLADWVERHRPEQVVALAFHRENASREGKHEELARLHLAAARKCLDIFDAERAKWFAENAKKRSVSSAMGFRCSLVMAEAHALCRNEPESLGEYEDAISLARDEADRLTVAESAARSLVGRFGSQAALRVVISALRTTRFRISSSKFFLFFSVVWAFINSDRRLGKPLSDPLAQSFAWVCARLGPVLVTSPLYMFIFLLRGLRVEQTRSTVAGPVVLAYWGAVLLAMRKPVKAMAAFEKAVLNADKNHDRWVQGVVRHVQSHGEQLPSGHYALGQANLEDALVLFGRSGDMSIGALSYMFRCFYGRDYEAVENISEWATNGDEAAERQHNRMAQWPCRGFALLAEAKCGRGSLQSLSQTVERILSDTSALEGDRFIALVAIAEAMLFLGHPKASLDAASKADDVKPAGPRLDCFLETEVVRFKCELFSAKLNPEAIATVGREYLSRFARLEKRYARFSVWRQVSQQLAKGLEYQQLELHGISQTRLNQFRSTIGMLTGHPAPLAKPLAEN